MFALTHLKNCFPGHGNGAHQSFHTELLRIHRISWGEGFATEESQTKQVGAETPSPRSQWNGSTGS